LHIRLVAFVAPNCPSSLFVKVMPGYGADCGGRIDLTEAAEWVRIASPNYPAEFREGQECSWLLVAPPGQRVQLCAFSFFGPICLTLMCLFFRQFYGEFEM
jgi:hypothetical protein